MIFLTDKQQKFADEYLIDCNASRAYKAAYPNVKSDAVARAAGARLLTKVNVRAYVDKKLDEISSKKTADAREVEEYLTSVMRGQSKASVVVIEGAGDGYSEAKIIEKPPDEKERLKAAELLGKRHSLFTNKDLLQAEKEIKLLEKKKLERDLGQDDTTSAVDDWVSSIPDVLEGDTDES